jgi:hypothetical protein
MLVWFTNSQGYQIAIDNRHVVNVYETTGITVVETVKDSFQLKEPILEVVSRLNTSN